MRERGRGVCICKSRAKWGCMWVGEEVGFKGELCNIIVGNFYCYLGQFLRES